MLDSSGCLFALMKFLGVGLSQDNIDLGPGRFTESESFLNLNEIQQLIQVSLLASLT
jgi:hypothetical protein